MTVMIDEMHVDVMEAPARAAPAPPTEPKQELNLTDALLLLRERRARLIAD